MLTLRHKEITWNMRARHQLSSSISTTGSLDIDRCVSASLAVLMDKLSGRASLCTALPTGCNASNTEPILNHTLNQLDRDT